MKCYNCGQLIPDDSEFCQYCGKRIGKNVEEDIASDKLTDTDEFDLFDLENATPEEALDAIIKIQAEETVKNLKENSKNQPNNEEDVDFGLIPQKPIYTLANMSVDGEREYLNQLYTENGVKIKWNRRGSTSVNGISGMIDVYDTFLPSGEPYKTIYINMYGAKKSEKAPVGFILNNVEAKRKKKPKKEKKVKTKFCSRCGSVVDRKTKICSGCGKKYFKGIKFNKFFTTVLILSFVIISSIILNIVQLVKTNELNADIEYYKQKSSEQQTKISSLNKEIKEKDNTLAFFDRHVVIVGDDGTKKYHKYGCDDLDTSYFWAYNIEAAKDRGYYACSKCSPGKTAFQVALDKFKKRLD